MQTLKISNDISKLHQALGKKLYSDKYCFISEMCQNAVDSHRMAGVKEPVVVGIRYDKVDRNQRWFYVRDKGLSFEDKEDFIAKICTILQSGKSEEKTNDENCAMGMHGIGSISVSKYQTQWNYTVVNHGRKFLATLKETEGVGLQYELGAYEATDEEKYVLFEVEIPLYGTQPLVEAMKQKLCYFKDIMFEFEEDIIRENKELLTLNSAFKLYQSDDFQISTLSKNPEVHICLDQYVYPIRWNDIGIKPIPLNIGLRFGMGDGLSADITRENLNMTESYKTIVNEKLRKVAEWFVERHNKEVKDDFTSIQAIKPYISTADKKVSLNGVEYLINDLAACSKIPIKQPTFKGVPDHNLLVTFMARTNYGLGLFERKYFISDKGSKVERNQSFTSANSAPDKKSNILVTTPISKSVMSYIKEKMRSSSLIYKMPITLKNKAGMSYSRLLPYEYFQDKGWKKEYKATGINPLREAIKQYCVLENAAAEDYFTDVKNIVVPPNWRGTVKKAPKRKEKVSVKDLSGEVGIKYAQPLVGYNGLNCKFVEKTVKVKDLYKTGKFHVYGTNDQKGLLDKLFIMGRGIKSFSACVIGVKDRKHIEELNFHNFMSVEEFKKGKHPIFRKLMTGTLITKDLLAKYPSTFRNSEIIRDHICKSFGEDLKMLADYTRENKLDNEFNYYSKIKGPFTDELLSIAETTNLYDLNIQHVVNNVKKEIEKFDFVDYFADDMTGKPGGRAYEKAKIALVDLARQRKIRQNWENYKLMEDVGTGTNGEQQKAA